MKKGFYGRKLKELRLNSGKTQTELANFLKLSNAYVCDVENGNRNPFSTKENMRISKFLGVYPESLLYARAQEVGFFELPFKAKDYKAQLAGLFLASLWQEFDENEYQKLTEVTARHMFKIESNKKG